jgi:hypothetical protein
MHAKPRKPVPPAVEAIHRVLSQSNAEGLIGGSANVHDRMAVVEQVHAVLSAKVHGVAARLLLAENSRRRNGP